MEKITEIQIVPIKPKNGIVAFASFVLNQCLYLSSVAIMTRPTGEYRLVYPTKKVGPKDIHIFHPISRDFAQTVEKNVIEKLEKVMSRNDRYYCPDASTS